MDMLMNDGLIVKRRGYGTCVQPKKVEQTMKRVLHFSEEMQKKGYTSSTKMLSNEMLPASKLIADALQIPEGCPLVRVTRLRYANGVPLCLEIAHLVYERLPRGVWHRLFGNVAAQFSVAKVWYRLDDRAPAHLRPSTATSQHAKSPARWM